jgi:hypothetical protein
MAWERTDTGRYSTSNATIFFISFLLELEAVKGRFLTPDSPHISMAT